MSTKASTSTDIYSGNVPQTATSFWALVLGDYNNAFYKAIIGFLLVIVLILAGAYFFGKYNQSLGTMGVLIFFFLGVVISTVIGLFSTGLIILMLVGSIVIIIVKTMLFPSQGTG
jgi:lipopolysaccharide export LptBFGC system permease protein LptF